MEDAFEAVTAAGGSSQADPTAVGGGADAALESYRRQVVAFVDDDEPVATEDLGSVVTASQGLEGDEVDDPAAASPSATELADLAPLQAEQVAEALAPLLGEGPHVHEHEGRRGEAGDDSAGHDGLARTRRRHEDPEIVSGDRLDGVGLGGAELAGEAERSGGRPRAPVVDLEAAAGRFDDLCGVVEQARGR